MAWKEESEVHSFKSITLAPKEIMAIIHYYQFGCRISKMVGPKQQDFWPRINLIKGKKNLLMNDKKCQNRTGTYFQSQF